MPRCLRLLAAYLIVAQSVELPRTVSAAETVTEGKKAGDLRDDNGLKLNLVWCPPGKFKMGEVSGAVDVTLTRGFWLGQTSVTQAQWKTVMGTTPWSGKDYVKEGVDYPATFVNWDEATEFCKKFTASESATGRLPKGYVYALPTEAQREYATRAGTTTTYSFGDDESKLGDYGPFGKKCNVIS